MKFSRRSLFLTASLPVSASFIVLCLAGVGKRVWTTHLLLICAACLLVGVGKLLDRWLRGVMPAYAIVLVTLAGLAATLLSGSSGPQRWIQVGPLNLYIAPLLLPSFLAACPVFIQSRGASKALLFPVLSSAGVLLAIQPDASQALALFTGAIILIFHYRAKTTMSIAAMAAIALMTACAFMRPDPLQPVPHVEGVFALALEQSMFTGLVVIASAIILIACLWMFSLRGPIWLSAVAGYYAVLFCCSVAGLTPAPLIGFGAGPLLGYGLMTAVSLWMEPKVLPDNSSKPAPRDSVQAPLGRACLRQAVRKRCYA